MAGSGTYTRYDQRGAVRPRAVCLCLALVSILVVDVFGQRIDTLFEQQYCVGGCGDTVSVEDAPQIPAYLGYAGLTEGMHDSNHAFLYWVNERENALFTGWMRTADVSFYPIVFGSVPAYWTGALLSDDIPTGDAVAYTVGWAATAGSTILLKRLIGRQRPFVTHSNLNIRYSEDELRELGAESSMPSGHSSMSVFVATFMAMKVDAPVARISGGVWASSVAMSRVWNGVHFPGDVLVGSALGAGFALLSAYLE